MNVTTLWGLLYSFLYNNNKKKDCVIIFDETLLSLDAFLYNKKKQKKWIGIIIFDTVQIKTGGLIILKKFQT